jgi:RecA-family ATPase
VGKTTLATQLACCVALSRSFVGLDVRAGPAMLVSLEDDRDELHRRIAAICECLGDPLAALADQLALWDLRGDPNALLGGFDADAKWAPSPFFDELEAVCRDRKITLLVLDNLAHLFGGNENDRAAVTRFVAALDGLAQRCRLSVVLIGHPAKVEGSQWSGSTAWEAAVRARLFLERPKMEGKEVDGPERVLQRSKANYAAKGERLPLTWWRGAFWKSGELPAEAASDQDLHGRDAEIEGLFMEFLAQLAVRGQAVSASRNAGNYAPKIMAQMDGAEALTKVELERALVRLLARGKLIDRAELWRGPDRKPVFGLKAPGQAADEVAEADGW